MHRSIVGFAIGLFVFGCGASSEDPAGSTSGAAVATASSSPENDDADDGSDQEMDTPLVASISEALTSASKTTDVSTSCASPQALFSTCDALSQATLDACSRVLVGVGCMFRSAPKEFCAKACGSQKGIVKKRVCVSACEKFLDEVPEPSSGLAKNFVKGACEATTQEIRQTLDTYCKAIRARLQSTASPAP